MNEKKDTMMDFYRKMYESYCNNMKFYGKEKEILPFKKWMKEVNNVKCSYEREKNLQNLHTS